MQPNSQYLCSFYSEAKLLAIFRSTLTFHSLKGGNNVSSKNACTQECLVFSLFIPMTSDSYPLD
jgi:hypothetical protein